MQSPPSQSNSRAASSRNQSDSPSRMARARCGFHFSAFILKIIFRRGRQPRRCSTIILQRIQCVRRFCGEMSSFSPSFRHSFFTRHLFRYSLYKRHTMYPRTLGSIGRSQGYPPPPPLTPCDFLKDSPVPPRTRDLPFELTGFLPPRNPVFFFKDWVPNTIN